MARWRRPPSRDFLIASTRQWRRSVWARRAAVATVVVFALIAAVAAQVAMRQRDEAVFRQVMAEADRMQAADPSLSARLNLVAHQLRPGDKDVYTRLVATQSAPLATPLVGHRGAVYLTSFSPDGNTLATASYDRTARLWDMMLFGGGFIIIGGEWFQMWQSTEWNGTEAALRNFLIASVGLVLAHQFRPELPSETQHKPHRITPA